MTIRHPIRSLPARAAAVCFASLLALPARAEDVKESHQLLGALVEITVTAQDAETGQNRIRDAVTVAHRLEAQLSPDDASSELARLNANAGLAGRRVSLDLYRLLALSQLMTRSTGGAFDVTVGPLLKRRPGAAQGAAMERAQRIDVDAALSLVGADRIELKHPNVARLQDAGMAVDFGAILPGYMLERMARSLRDAGVAKALLVFAESTALAVGPPAEDAPFRIWIPRGKSMAGSVALRDQSISTLRAHHRGEDATLPMIVDPRSGRFVESDRQATVIARDAAIAEAWSTALVVDPDGALGLLDEPRDAEALVFDEHGVHKSPRFDQLAAWRPGGTTPAPAEPPLAPRPAPPAAAAAPAAPQ